jgi:hypothetical protein
LVVANFELKRLHGFSKIRSHCGWIAAQDSGWVEKVIDALKRRRENKSKVSRDKNTVTETSNGDGTQVWPAIKVSVSNQSNLREWDRLTTVNINGAVAVSPNRIRERTESFASDRGDTRSSRSDAC